MARRVACSGGMSGGVITRTFHHSRAPKLSDKARKQIRRSEEAKQKIAQKARTTYIGGCS